MYAVGAIPRRAERLIEVTYEAMMRGIAVIRPGATSGDIGFAIQSFVEAQHMSVVRDFCGHGLGRLFHDEPNIVHIGRAGEGIVLKPGMFFTVEPMINLGRPHVKVLSDGWTAVTRDRSLSAQFEHTVAVTETGVEIFTLSPQGLGQPRSQAFEIVSWRAAAFFPPPERGGWRRRRRVGVPHPHELSICCVTPTRPASRVDLPLAGGGKPQSGLVSPHAIATQRGRRARLIPLQNPKLPSS
jgi:hypothetical protein